MKIKTIKKLTLYKNNKMSIALTKNVKNLYQTRHISIQHYYIRKLVNKRDFIIKYFLN